MAIFKRKEKEKKALVICFEGLDCSGKDTQINLLENYFYQKEISYVTHPKKGSNVYSEKLKSVIIEGKELDALSANDEVDLWSIYLAKVLDQVKKDVEDNDVIILNRYIYSYIAMQGVALDKTQEALARVQDFLKPDIVFYLRQEPEFTISRLEKRGFPDGYEALGLEYYSKVFKGYESFKDLPKAALPHPLKEWITIENTLDGKLCSSATIHALVVEYLIKYLKGDTDDK